MYIQRNWNEKVMKTFGSLPEEFAEAPGVQMFSVLSAVPIDASDSGVSSSDVRGSKINISYVSSSLVDTHRHRHVQANITIINK